MSDTQRRQLIRILCIGMMVSLLALLRVIWLDSDGYAGLTWSSELVTDEAFYCHDARNIVLGGSSHIAGDNFHNALIMPLLHLVQVGVFRAFGFSLVASRFISVVFSFVTLALFYAACRRAFGSRVALSALLLLGFDHINLLYNRMALMDTPAQMPLVACFYTVIRAFPAVSNGESNTSNGDIKNPSPDGEGAANATTHERRKGVGVRCAGWLTLCGLLLPAAYAIRGLSALLVPVMLVLLWPVRWPGEVSAYRSSPYDMREARHWLPIIGLLSGLFIGFVVYLCTWYLPNYALLQTVNRFYVAQQLMPHSLEEVRHNIGHSLFGNERGFSSYLFRHSPVQWTLALAWLLTWPALRMRTEAIQHQATRSKTQAIRFLMLWLGIMLTAFALVRYSPPRYYVLFYPALAALAALTLAHITEVTAIIANSRIRRTALGMFLVYHLAEAGIFQHLFANAELLLYGLTLVAGAALWLVPTKPFSIQRSKLRETRIERGTVFDSRFLQPARVSVSIMVLWAIVNVGWLLDWAGHIRYTQRDCDRWLQQHLPASAVLIGDPAPGMTLRSRFTSVPVIPGLCNDDRPLEAFADRPCYILLFEGPNPLRWWKQHYVQWITPEHCIRRFVVFGKFRLVLYQAQPLPR